MNAIAMRCEPGYRGSGRFDCSARCARCISWLASLAAIFAGKPPSSSDPTNGRVGESAHFSDAFRRLLLQIGGASIASVDRADEPLSSASLGDGKRVSSLVLRSAARDPVQILDRNVRNWICWLEAEDLA
jgi:hypothetical protein